MRINKSKLNYYVSLGLLQPTQTLGKTMIFERSNTIDIIKFIDKQKRKGMKLREIKELL